MKHRTTSSSFLRPAAVVPTLAAVLLLAACSGSKTAKQGPPPAVPVTVATAQAKDVPVQVHAIGTVEPYDTVGVKSQVEGQLVSVHFKEGDFVRKGQLLFNIDRRPFEENLHKAEAQLQKDIAEAANAHAQATRYEALQKQGIVAREQAETVITAAQTAEATVNADKAAVEQARVQLTYCSISSPIDGRTGNLMVHAGNIVKADADTPMVTINRITPIYATFAVPKQSLPDIKRAVAQHTVPVQARPPSDTGTPSRGTLTFIDNAVDPQTGQIKMKGTFANTDHKMWPGQFVDVTLTLATQANATVVPKAAVQSGQNGDYVFVVKPDKTAENRNVKIGRGIGNEIVVDAGLHPGEVVVTDGQVRLVPGARVDIRANAANSGPTSAAFATPDAQPVSAADEVAPTSVAGTPSTRQAGQ